MGLNSSTPWMLVDLQYTFLVLEFFFIFLDFVISLTVCGHTEALAVCVTAEAGI
jgi:hypothetical protein